MFISAVKLCYFIDIDNVGLMERIGRKETLIWRRAYVSNLRAQIT